MRDIEIENQNVGRKIKTPPPPFLTLAAFALIEEELVHKDAVDTVPKMRCVAEYDRNAAPLRK